MSIKKISVIVLLAILIIISIISVAAFLYNGGSAEAYEKGLNTVGKSTDNNNIANNLISNSIDENNINTNTVVNEISNNVIASEDRVTNSDNRGSAEQELPEETIIQKERVVSETLSLSWNHINLKSNSKATEIGIYRDTVGYIVEYYYDNEKDPTKTERSSAVVGSQVLTYKDKQKDGYKFDKIENLPLTISDDFRENIIKVYYVKDEFNYTVEYYYDNVIDNSKTETGKAEFESQITTYVDKQKDGYRFDKTENLPLTITSDSTKNVIKVYYVKDEFNYTVEYYYDNVIDNSKTETGKVEFESQITTYIDKQKDGYKFDKTENLPLTIASDSTKNVIKVYYVKDEFNYTVEYYYDNVIDNSKTETGKAEFESQITTYVDKQKDGYRFDKTENLPLTITSDLTKNVIRVYYVSRTDLSYTVKYFYNGVEDTTPGVSYTVDNQTLGSYVTSFISKSDLNGGNWVLDIDSTTALPFVIGAGANIINVYYVKSDIVVNKEAPAVANAGSVIEYKITLTNNGLLTDSVDVIDTLPDGIIVDTSSLAEGVIYNDTDRTITWEDISVSNGTPVVLTFKAKISENKIGATLINNVELSNGASDTATTVVKEVALDVEEIIQGISDKDDVNITLVIDISSTMQRQDVDDKGTTRLQSAINAAKVLVENLYAEEINKDATFSLVAFDNAASIKLVGKGYDDKIDIINAINSLPTDGYGTNMYDGLVKAEKVIDSLNTMYPYNQNVIIFLGDGSPYGDDPNNTYSGIIRKAVELRKTTTLYTIGFGRDVAEVSTDPESGYYILSHMATPGKFYTAVTDVELSNIFMNVAEEINNRTRKVTVEGIVKIPTTKEIVVSEESPIIMKYKGNELFRCNSLDDLLMYYMSYGNKEIVWDINKWNSKDSNIKIVSNDLKITYYIPRD